MNKPSVSSPRTEAEQVYDAQPPPRPAFGFLVGGTMLGIFFGCILLCAGASPTEVIIISLAILGAMTGGLLEWLWPKYRPPKPVPPSRQKPTLPKQEHECHRCGEVFEPSPVICPMCGHADQKPAK